MTEIIKKTYSDLFEKILSGKKKFDLRLADFDVKEGDILVLKEIDANRNYTGRKLRKKITFILKTKNLDYWDTKDINKKGFVVMSLE
jgi:hypothetical protein